MNRQKAFTLAELLVAMAITSVLATLLVSIVSATMNVWTQGRNQIDTLANARQVLTRMADEMKGAIASSQVQFAENSDSLKGTTDPEAGTFENLFFVAPYPNNKAGDLCVFAYRLNKDTKELQRAFIDSEKAWNSGSVNRYQIAGYTDLENEDPASTPWRTIARGVLEFEIKSYSQADLDNGTEYGRPPAATPAPNWNSQVGSGMIGNTPRRVVVRLRVIDDKSLVRLNALPPTGAAHDRVIAQAAREFTADINLLSPHPTPTPTPTP